MATVFTGNSHITICETHKLFFTWDSLSESSLILLLVSFILGLKCRIWRFPHQVQWFQPISCTTDEYLVNGLMTQWWQWRDQGSTEIPALPFKVLCREISACRCNPRATRSIHTERHSTHPSTGFCAVESKCVQSQNDASDLNKMETEANMGSINYLKLYNSHWRNDDVLSCPWAIKNGQGNPSLLSKELWELVVFTRTWTVLWNTYGTVALTKTEGILEGHENHSLGHQVSVELQMRLETNDPGWWVSQPPFLNTCYVSRKVLGTRGMPYTALPIRSKRYKTADN